MPLPNNFQSWCKFALKGDLAYHLYDYTPKQLVEWCVVNQDWLFSNGLLVFKKGVLDGLGLTVYVSGVYIRYQSIQSLEELFGETNVELYSTNE